MKQAVAFILAVMAAIPLYAGKVRTVAGSVDVLEGGKWVRARQGMEIRDNTKIMTGMDSSITIDGKAGTVTVRELSMVTYGEKSTDKSVDQKVDLSIGKVRVRFTKARGIRSSFKVQTPKGTASVRGTEKDVFGYPVSGFGVNVLSGGADISDNYGNSFLAGAGEQGGVGGDGGLFGDGDINGGDAGFGNQFGDDDAFNDFLNDFLDDFYNDLFNFLDEPERL